MKKILLSITLATILLGVTGVTIYNILTPAKEYAWESFAKLESTPPQKVPLTVEDKKEIRKLARKPTSASKKNPTNKFYREGRTLIGPSADRFQNDNLPLFMKNTSNPEWKKQTVKHLLAFQLTGTKILFKKTEGIIKIENKEGRYLEKIVAQYVFPNGERSSFRAYVDSSTGAIVRVWDRTQKEIRKPVRLTP